jgi:hypothetical protein
MGGFVSRPKPPAPPPVPKPTVVETTASQAADAGMSEAIKTKRRGRRATILNENKSLGNTSVAKKTLLG